MTRLRITNRLVAAASLSAVLALGGTALAQTSAADGGDPAVTEPGGTMGRDGAANIREGVEDGEAVGVPRGTVIDGERRERRGPPVAPAERR